MTRVIWRLAARLGALLLFFFFLFLISLPNLIDIENFRPQLLQLLRANIAGQVEIGRIGLSFSRGPGIRINRVKIVDRTGKQQVAVDEAIVNFSLGALFQRRLQIAGLVLVHPRIELSFSDPGKFLSGFVRPKPAATPVIKPEAPAAVADPDKNPLDLGGGWHFSPRFNHAVIEILDGSVVFTDSWTCASPVTTHLEGFKLSAKWYGTGVPAQFSLSSRVVNSGNQAEGYLRISGILSSLHFPIDPGKMYLDCHIEALNLDGTNYFPYYSEYVPMRHVGGLVDIDTTYQGSLMGLFHARGRIVVRRVEFDYPEVFGHRLTARRLSVDCDFRLADHYNTIEIKDCIVDLDGFRVLGQCLLHDVRSYVDGKIDVDFRVPEFDPTRVIPWLPAEIMPPAVRRAASGLAGGRCEIRHAYLHCRYRQLLALAGSDPPKDVLGAELSARDLVFKIPGIHPERVGLGGHLVFADTNLSCDDVSFSWGGLTGRKSVGRLENIYRTPRFQVASDIDLDLAAFWQQLLRLPAEARLQEDRAGGLAAETHPFCLTAGRLAGRLALRGNLEAPEKLICRGHLKAVDAAFTAPGLESPVTAFNGKFELADTGFSLSAGHGRLGEMAFTCSGRTETPEKLYRDWDAKRLPFAARFACPEISPEDLNLLREVKEKLAVRGRLAGPSSISLQVAGDFFKPGELKLAGRVDLDWADLVLAALPSPLKTLQVKAGFAATKIDCEKFSLKTDRSDFSFHGKLVNRADGRDLRGEFNSERLCLDDFLTGSASPPELSWPTGLEVDLKGRVGELQLPTKKSVHAFGADSDWQHLYNCELSLQAGPRTGLAIKRCAWFWGKQKSHFSLSGKLDSFPDFQGRLALQVDDLDIDKLLHREELEVVTQEEDNGAVADPQAGELVMEFKHLAEVVEPDQVKTILAWKKWLAPHRIKVEVGARKLVFKRMLIDRLSGKVRLDRNGIFVDRMDGKSFAGDIFVSGEWLFAGDNFDLDIDFHQINLEKLNDFLDNPNRGFPMQGGQGTLLLALDWHGENLEAWRRNLDGLGDFSFRDGKMKRFTLVGNICSLLNLSQFASLKLPKFSSGVPYKNLKGRVTILNGVAEVEDFSLKGPSLNLLATGTVDLVKQQVDLDFGIQPLQTVDKLLASIPVVGYIMTGDKKTFIIIPVSVKGPFDGIKIETKSIKGLGEKAGDMIRRFFSTPFRLLGLGGKGP